MSKAIEIQAEQWEDQVVKAETPVVIDFWHQMCGWCLKLNPIFDQLPERFGDRVKFFKMNVLEKPDNQQLAIGLGILGTPTIKVFCQGRPVGEIVGFRPLDRLAEDIEQIIENKDDCLRQSTPLKK